MDNTEIVVNTFFYFGFTVWLATRVLGATDSILRRIAVLILRVCNHGISRNKALDFDLLILPDQIVTLKCAFTQIAESDGVLMEGDPNTY